MDGAEQHPKKDESASGSIGRRRAGEDDDAFCHALFGVSRPPGEDLALLGARLRETLMRQQYEGQQATYRARFPHACFEIVTMDGAPIGRLVIDRSGAVLTVVDIALLPAWRGRGIGTCLMRQVMDEAKAARVAVHLSVRAGNGAARRLYERLGFEPRAGATLDVEMDWRG